MGIAAPDVSRTFRHIFAIVAFLSGTMVLGVGCDTCGDDGDTKPIVGRWRLVSVEQGGCSVSCPGQNVCEEGGNRECGRETIQFNSNGSLVKQGPIDGFRGDYTVEKNTISICIPEAGCVSAVYRIADDWLTIEYDRDEDSSLETWARVSAKDADYTNSLGMMFTLIPFGTFTMGSPEGEPGRSEEERQHRVTLTKMVYMQTTEVTQGQWRAVMGSNPALFSSCGDNCPVEWVSWKDVQAFIERLNALGEGTYRLPTEAEWEYAARAGTTTAFANGDISSTDSCVYDVRLEEMAWYCGGGEGGPQPAGWKLPNARGLYDMHGNVYEWCLDWWAEYPSAPVVDPVGPENGDYRVIRGGSWVYNALYARSAARDAGSPDFRSGDIGFRLVRTVY